MFVFHLLDIFTRWLLYWIASFPGVTEFYNKSRRIERLRRRMHLQPICKVDTAVIQFLSFPYWRCGINYYAVFSERKDRHNKVLWLYPFNVVARPILSISREWFHKFYVYFMIFGIRVASERKILRYLIYILQISMYLDFEWLRSFTITFAATCYKMVFIIHIFLT